MSTLIESLRYTADLFVTARTKAQPDLERLQGQDKALRAKLKVARDTFRSANAACEKALAQSVNAANEKSRLYFEGVATEARTAANKASDEIEAIEAKLTPLTAKLKSAQAKINRWTQYAEGMQTEATRLEGTA